MSAKKNKNKLSSPIDVNANLEITKKETRNTSSIATHLAANNSTQLDISAPVVNTTVNVNGGGVTQCNAAQSAQQQPQTPLKADKIWAE